MSDKLQDRMRRMASSKQGAEVAASEPPAAFIRPSKPFPHRVTLDLAPDHFDALRAWAHRERLPMAELLRGLVGICRADERLEASVVASVRAHRDTEAQKHRSTDPAGQKR